MVLIYIWLNHVKFPVCIFTRNNRDIMCMMCRKKLIKTKQKWFFDYFKTLDIFSNSPRFAHSFFYFFISVCWLFRSNDVYEKFRFWYKITNSQVSNWSAFLFNSHSPFFISFLCVKGGGNVLFLPACFLSNAYCWANLPEIDRYALGSCP